MLSGGSVTPNVTKVTSRWWIIQWMVLPSIFYITIYWMSGSTNKTYWASFSIIGCWFIQCINRHPTIEKLAFGIFFVAVNGGWSVWSQWSHCTRSISGIQVRIRRCVNPDPQSDIKPCPGPDVTVIRGCTNISRCREGISQMLQNFFAFYPMPPRDFLSPIRSLLI